MSEANESGWGPRGPSPRGGAQPRGTTEGAADEPPPFWSRWSRIYWFIAGLLAAETLAFWLVSRWAS